MNCFIRFEKALANLENRGRPEEKVRAGQLMRDYLKREPFQTLSEGRQAEMLVKATESRDLETVSRIFHRTPFPTLREEARKVLKDYPSLLR